jgi:hypothetical protein
VKLILPGHPSNFCKHLTDRHHIAQNQTEIGKFLSQKQSVRLAKSYGQPGKNQLDVTKIGSATVHVNGALAMFGLTFKSINKEAL